MKITSFLLLIVFMQVSAATTYSQSTKLNLKYENVKLSDLLDKIEKASDYRFFYNSQSTDLSEIVSVNSKDSDIKEVLDKVLGSNLAYELVSNNIIVIKSKTTGTEVLSGGQQQKSVSGKVTDSSGSPLPGVSIVIKGTTKGTITNMDGTFTLSSIPPTAKTLTFSFVGMKQQEVPIGNKTIFNIKMEDENVGLDEVVAIGYGSVKRKDLTGSVASVKMIDMSKAPVPSFDQALAGRVAGVQVASVDGQPGASINIVIRGTNSITQDNSPLYVVDGFPIEGNDNNSINPNDIESIDVLKDASATAIYGARGANGVIMITTKRGKEGAPVVRYDGYYGSDFSTRKIPVLNPYEFVKLQLEINNAYATENYLANGKTLDDYKNEKGIDWYDLLMQNGQTQNHSLSVSGGTNKSKYSVSASVVDQAGIVRYSGFNRYQGRVTLDQTINNKLKFGISSNYSEASNYGTFVNTTVQGSPTGGFMYSAWSFRPVQTGTLTIDPEEDLMDPAVDRQNQQVNPIVQARNEVREGISINLLANAYVEYLITKDLKFRVTGGMSRATGKNISFNNSKTRTGNPMYPLTTGVNGSQVTSENKNFSNENTLTYAKTIKKYHSINIVGGFSVQRGESATFGASAIQLPNESLEISGLDEGTPQTITSTSSLWTLQSFYSRFYYSYKSKYILNATIRTDGSSKFSPKHKWGYFPSIGLVYRVGQEKFMKEVSFISDAKVRVSYGATGNNRVGDFSYLSPLSFIYYNYYSFGNVIPSVGGTSLSFGNTDLKWESTKQFNAGIDIYLLKERLSFTGDYYYKRTDDLLLNADVQSTSGYTKVFKNIGSVSNSGIELTLNSINIQSSKFKWSSSFNISFNRNKVISLTEGQETLLSTSGGVFGGIAKNIAKVGYPVAYFYGPIFDGLYQYEDFNKLTNGTYVLKDEMPSNGSTRSMIQPGYAKYKDLNGDGVVNSYDYTVTGNPNPIFAGGFTNNFDYKGFDLNVFFQFSYGNDVLNANRITFEGYDNFLNNLNMYATYANRWTPTNTNTDIPYRAGRGPSYWSSRFVEDASFLRLKTVSLGYTLPAKILQTIKIRSARIYASAQNLYTWTGYSGLDPEVSVRHSTLTPGLDYSAYPKAKTITLGVNVTF